MRYFIFFSLLLSLAIAQNDSIKHDYIWRRGPTHYHGQVSFHTNPFSINPHIPKGIEVGNGGSIISNRQGELQLLSGCYNVADTNGHIIATGLSPDDLNYDTVYSANGARCATWVEDPADSSRYYLLHAAVDIDYVHSTVYNKSIYYTHVGKNAQGDWVVLAKNQLLLHSDTAKRKYLLPLNITVCRHANGRDWWFIAPEVYSKRYCRFLISPQGVQNMGWVGDSTVKDMDFIAGATGTIFSPDGKHYVLHSDSLQLYVWDFDRCNGTFSNERKYNTRPDSTKFAFVAQVFSASGRYMYYTQGLKIWQCDMQASDPFASRQVVAVWDGTVCTYNCVFTQPQLGPDGRIYWASGGDSWHIIEYPDSAGIACSVKQHSLWVGNGWLGGITMFPNYRLGVLKGSGCDTLKTSVELPVASSEQVRVYPNPAATEVTISVENTSGFQNLTGLVVRLTNTLGQAVSYKGLASPFDYAQGTAMPTLKMDVSHLPTGIYFYAVRNAASEVVAQGKLQISR